MTIPELAEYLQVPQNTLYRLAKARRDRGFPAFKIGRNWRVNLEQVEEWLLLAWENGQGSSAIVPKVAGISHRPHHRL